MVKYSYQINAWKKCPCSKWKHIFCERLIKYFAWKNYLEQSTGCNCLGSNYLEGNYPGVIIRGSIILVPIVRGQFFWGSLPGGQLSRGDYPGGQLSKVQLSWRAVIRGEIIQGAIVLEPLKEVFWKTSQNSGINTRSSHLEVFCQKKRCSKNLAKFTAKYLFRSLFLNKVAGWKSEIFRNSHQRCSVKQGALKNFANFTGNNLCWSLFLIKLDIQCQQLNQRRLWHTCFPVKFAIILKKICACLPVNFI